MTTLETYRELKTRHEKELNDFQGVFFAFSNEQFKQGMEKVGLTEKDTNKIFSLRAGGYILRDRSRAFCEMFKRHEKERKQRNKDEKFLIESIAYELANHEYCITYDVTNALNALGLEQKDIDPKVLKKAIDLSY